jgi:CRISPR-associated exonuclease Cas4
MVEDELIAISALQHWVYCPRQCGLIHLDQAFDENVHTLRGRAVHQRVDQPGASSPTMGIRVERALPLWHDELGLIGKADAVEFMQDGQPYPVEYKNGSRHKLPDIAACDDVQLAAQAMCLESMTGHVVPEGALFYASSKRRRVLLIDTPLRQKVKDVTNAVRQMLQCGTLPDVLVGALVAQRCPGCSLRDRCQPDLDLATVHALHDHLFDPDW